MNVGEIKAFVSEQKPAVAEQKAPEDPNKAIKKQLQQDGLRQAAEFQQRQIAMVSVSSSQTTIGLKVYSSSMEQQVSVDGQRGKFAKDDTSDKEKETSLFDFEEVAKNVMRFVGGVIQGAARGGADEEKLGNLFSQAREGVSRGIAMAEKDLGGLMNDDISTGIDRSRSLIDNRINALESDLLGIQNEDQLAAGGVASALNVNSSNSESASLTIRTRDGDEVQLSFESLRAYQYASKQTVAYSTEQGQGGDGNGYQNVVATDSTSYSYFDRQGISFSLKGELDEGELTAIADLVESVNALADTFFGGDLDKAFEKALELGFDDQELTGYALQLNRTQQTEVVKTYGAIQHYRDGSESGSHGDEAKPVAQYLNKMLNAFDSARQQLASGEDFNTLINGLINEMKDVQVPDLVSAINRFHSFNQRLLDAMPGEQQKTQPVEPPASES
ncbi:DUF5610 domain-containing protein [Alteromonas sp. 1_MG-2023]|uniref:DUF5610 domain-containing protein n=1 Tax=Alteromonas sp. 1_MG-2023 TaxID=3062669 RepID=UPI0026E35022|nr:DUF5610 domain-containing protein [Alteromonas sp. 1_MG-2023]MDO6476983.1 DUF5610 domain-containing protein [Alteromonas sp. 1_MG-2023]